MELGIALPILIVLLLVLLFSGLEIAFSVGIVGVVGLLLLGSEKIPLESLAVLAWSVASSYVFMAIALFVFMTALIQQSGVAAGLYTAATSWVGRLPGGLALGCVAACTLNSPASTSSQANVAAIGSVAVPEIERHGHSRRLTFGALAAGGTLSLLILPSTAMIVYAVFAGVSIGITFIACLIPGLILSLLFMVYVFIVGCFGRHLAPRAQVPSGKQLVIGLVNMLAPLILGIIIFSGIFLGIMPPTEAAALAAFVAFFAAVIWSLVWRRPILSILRKAIRQTVQTTCMVMLILIVGAVFARVLAVLGTPEALVELINELQMSRWLVFGLVCLAYVIIGCFIEPLTLMVLSLPLLAPVLAALGFDPIWFGVILVILIGVAMVLPPMGRNLRVVQSLSQGHPMKEIIIGAAPFVALMAVLLGLLVAFPQLALWLPGTIIR